MLLLFIMFMLILVLIPLSSSISSSLVLLLLLVGDPEFYKSKLLTALGENFSTEGFTIEKKADATYKIVSAG